MYLSAGRASTYRFNASSRPTMLTPSASSKTPTPIEYAYSIVSNSVLLGN
ncbi:hypothetical protein BMETH_1809_1 [methanotrophic bacterial endosymbiont of Bathymodiolus sp.]|nr:hypothetical protein BMETH_1809_1 [methanotrophic bacterial endosymbiont of Bathymodiolus sp.]